MTLNYAADPEGRTSAISAVLSQNPVTATTYNTFGQVTGVTYGSGDADTFSFDPSTALPTGYKLQDGAGYQNVTITNNTNRTMQKMQIADTIYSPNPQTCNYTYDDVHRLYSVDCGSIFGSQSKYDPFGNIAWDKYPNDSGTAFQPTYGSNHFGRFPD